MSGRAGLGVLLLIALAGLILRVPDPALRPLHNDEAVNAFKFEELWTHHRYHYDPNEFHGPALYYLSLPVVAVASWFHPDQPTTTSLRAVTVVFGTALFLLLLLVIDGLGWPALLWAAVFLAVSPATVFYSRYYIHETLLVFFTGLFLAALWRYSRRPSVGWAILAGGALGFMDATKETFVFAIAAAVVAWVLMILWESAFDPDPGRRAHLKRQLSSVPLQHVMLFVGAAFVVFVVLYTSFFTHLRGPVDALRTYLIWFERAGGASPHIHPWTFYFQRLGWFHPRGSPVWTELAVLVLAALGGLRVAWGRGLDVSMRRMGRFLLLYSIGLAGIYSVIPYKTPWCLLGFYHGFLVLAGIGAWSFVTTLRGWVPRVLAFGILLVAAGHLAWEARRANVDFPADPRNPYVYGQTSADIANLLERVSDLYRVHAEGTAMPMQVIVPESNYWPLPWYWRGYSKIGWWDHLPENPFAPVVIVASKLQASLDERSGGKWRMVGTFELRPRYFVEMFVETKLWNDFLAARRAEREETGE